MGAPLSEHLNWDEAGLLSTPTPPFQGAQVLDDEPGPSNDPHSVKWTVLRPLSADMEKDAEYPPFLTTYHLFAASSAARVDMEESVLSEFYDHSFAVHETSEISASGLRTEDSMQESSLWADSLETSTTTSTSGDRDVPESPPVLRIPGALSDLQDLPTPRYLESIAPQTMTVNLIAGVIAVHSPRRVVTRQWQRELDIVELVVGDETRTGFGINFWLLPAKPSSAGPANEHDRLRQLLATLRPQDIVLFRNVGLSSFQNQVYGQSLRRGMTQVALLHRQPVDATDAGGLYSRNIHRDSHDDLPLQKTRRVREWVLRFVGVPDQAGGGAPGKAQRRRLPPDTQ